MGETETERGGDRGGERDKLRESGGRGGRVRRERDRDRETETEREKKEREGGRDTERKQERERIRDTEKDRERERGRERSISLADWLWRWRGEVSPVQTGHRANTAGDKGSSRLVLPPVLCPPVTHSQPEPALRLAPLPALCLHGECLCPLVGHDARMTPL